MLNSCCTIRVRVCLDSRSHTHTHGRKANLSKHAFISSSSSSSRRHHNINLLHLWKKNAHDRAHETTLKCRCVCARVCVCLLTGKPRPASVPVTTPLSFSFPLSLPLSRSCDRLHTRFWGARAYKKFIARLAHTRAAAENTEGLRT